VGRLALGQVSLRVLRVCCVNYHSTDTPHSLTCHVGDKNGGQSRPQFHTDTFPPHYEHNNDYTLLYTAGHETSNGVAVAFFCLNFLSKMDFFWPLVLWPNAGHGVLFIEVCKSHTQSVGLLWTSDQLVMETSTSQHTTLTTEMYGRGGIRTRNLSRRVAADVRFRPRGIYIHRFI